MSNKNKEVNQQKDVVQAVLVAEHFGDDFAPISNDTSMVLLPLLNVALLDYSLEFLSLGGIEETFLFCCSNVEGIKEHIRKSIEIAAGWSLTMKVNVIVSETCRSFGDCLRDLDAKGLIRSDFVLLEPGTVGNIKLLPIIKKHSEIAKTDKGTAMTLVLQEVGVGQYGRCLTEELVLVSSPNNRVLFHQKLGKNNTKKIDVPLELLIENPTVNILHNLKDTHIAICSSSVLPLFSDNFDFQTRDDFVRGLLMNEEILGSTIYWHLIRAGEYGGCVTNWRMYQTISHDILHRWLYPLVPEVGISTQQRIYIHHKNNIYRNKSLQIAKSSSLKEDVLIGSNCSIAENTQIEKSVIGQNVKIGKNVCIEDSFIFENTIIEDNCTITHSIIGFDCILKSGSKITNASILGTGVHIPTGKLLEDVLVQSHQPNNFKADDKLGDHAYVIKLTDDGENSDSEDEPINKQFSRLYITHDIEESDAEYIELSENEEDLSFTTSPVPDDTNMFLTEVIDSLARGFEDKLQCDNLILEINSSRYAYNVTVKEVNFNVTKAILMLPFQLSVGQPYLLSLRPLLAYFSSILKNYIRNENAMIDCLQAIQDVALNNSELNDSIAAVLNWFYDKDHLTEDSILNWAATIEKSTRLYVKVQPFADWLQQAEEATSSEED